MAETAAHLVDQVIPAVPMRHWVLSLPHPLRYLLAYDASLCSEVLGAFIHEVHGWLRYRYPPSQPTLFDDVSLT